MQWSNRAIVISAVPTLFAGLLATLMVATPAYADPISAAIAGTVFGLTAGTAAYALVTTALDIVIAVGTSAGLSYAVKALKGRAKGSEHVND